MTDTNVFDEFFFIGFYFEREHFQSFKIFKSFKLFFFPNLKNETKMSLYLSLGVTRL